MSTMTIHPQRKQNSNYYIRFFFTLQDFELLCPGGGRRPPSDAEDCNWGVIPSHIVMTSAIHEEALRKVGRSATVSLKIHSMDPYPCFKCIIGKIGTY